MPQENQKTITMSGERLANLESKFKQTKSHQPGLSFASFVVDSALMELERKDLVSQALFISLVALQDNVVVLRDLRRDMEFVEVMIKDGSLVCRTCDDACVHVGFAWALPEVRRALST